MPDIIQYLVFALTLALPAGALFEQYTTHGVSFCYNGAPDDHYDVTCEGNAMIWGRVATLGYAFLPEPPAASRDATSGGASPWDAADCGSASASCTVPFPAFWERCNTRKSCDLSDITADINSSPTCPSPEDYFRPWINFLHISYSCVNVNDLLTVKLCPNDNDLQSTIVYQMDPGADVHLVSPKFPFPSPPGSITCRCDIFPPDDATRSVLTRYHVRLPAPTPCDEQVLVTDEADQVKILSQCSPLAGDGELTGYYDPVHLAVSFNKSSPHGGALLWVGYQVDGGSYTIQCSNSLGPPQPISPPSPSPIGSVSPPNYPPSTAGASSTTVHTHETTHMSVSLTDPYGTTTHSSLPTVESGQGRSSGPVLGAGIGTVLVVIVIVSVTIVIYRRRTHREKKPTKPMERVTVKRTASYGPDGEEIYDFIDESQIADPTKLSQNVVGPTSAFSNPKYMGTDDFRGGVYEHLGKRGACHETSGMVYDTLHSATSDENNEYLDLVDPPPRISDPTGVDNDAYEECV